MAKSRGKYRSRRGTARRPRHGLSIGKIVKGAIIFAPPAASAYSVWQQTKNPQQVASDFVAGYTAFDFASGTVQYQKLYHGLLPLGIAMVLSKFGVFRAMRL